MPATAADIELTRRYQRRLDNLARGLARQLGEAWDSLADYSTPAAWLEAILPILTAGQEQVASMAVAYVATLAEVPTPDVPDSVHQGPDPEGPLAVFGSALDRGLTFDAARALGRSRAEAVGQSSAQWTARAAVGTAAEAADGVVAWRRVLTGVSCDWCARIATQRYSTARSASFGHTRCDCTVVPIVGDRDPGQVINRPALDRLNATPADERTGYVGPEGDPVDRPESVPQERREEP